MYYLFVLDFVLLNTFSYYHSKSCSKYSAYIQWQAFFRVSLKSGYLFIRYSANRQINKHTCPFVLFKPFMAVPILIIRISKPSTEATLCLNSDSKRTCKATVWSTSWVQNRTFPFMNKTQPPQLLDTKTAYTNKCLCDSDESLSFSKGGMLMVMLTAAEDEKRWQSTVAPAKSPR